jgi:hypothetical protein
MPVSPAFAMNCVRHGDYMRIELNPSCGDTPLMVWGEGHDWVGGSSAPGHGNFRSLCLTDPGEREALRTFAFALVAPTS